MGSHILDILRQGIWASLTGGWFYDPYLTIFINTFHLYLWLFLLALPLILHLTLAPTLFIWALYCGIVGFVFVLVKVMNYKLHHMFDTSEMIEEVDTKISVKADSNPTVALCTEELPETFEMKELSSSASKNDPAPDQKMDSQPDTHSERSRKQSSETGVRKRRSRRTDNIQKVSSQKGKSRAPLAEMDKDEMDLSLQGAVGGTSRILTHHHGNTDEENVNLDEDTEKIKNAFTVHDYRTLPNTLSLPDITEHSQLTGHYRTHSAYRTLPNTLSLPDITEHTQLTGH